MFDIIKSIILGIVEGITEFLPISSTGHLILANIFISFSEDFTQKFDVIIQLGAILAVALIYWKKLLPNRDNPVGKSIRLWSKIIVATIPAIVLGALLHDKIELLFNPITVSIALVFWGIILIIIESFKITVKTDSLENMTYLTALLIGVIQCLGMIPGTSRSAATIIGAMLLGVSRLVAVEFSFFLAIPTLFAASVYSLYKIGLALTSWELLILAIGFLTSFAVAWIVIRFFIGFVSKHDFKAFGIYRIVLGVAVLVIFMFLR